MCLLLYQIKETDVARKRFPNAKSISSAQFLGDKENMDEKNTTDTEAKISLQKFSVCGIWSSTNLYLQESIASFFNGILYLFFAVPLLLGFFECWFYLKRFLIEYWNINHI